MATGGYEAEDRADVFAGHASCAAGQLVEYRSFPGVGHSLHGEDPERFARTLTEWAASLAPA